MPGGQPPSPVAFGPRFRSPASPPDRGPAEPSRLRAPRRLNTCRPDLPLAANVLGRLNCAAAVALTGARTDRAVTVNTEWAIPDFHGPRATTLNQPHVADLVTPLVTAGSVTIYKDSNRRNMMVTHEGIAIVDFDDLTLAPSGYDLAKLCVSAAMTYGIPATVQIPAIIDSYNAAGTPACSADAVAIWWSCPGS